jgi:hypothetical protein
MLSAQNEWMNAYWADRVSLAVHLRLQGSSPKLLTLTVALGILNETSKTIFFWFVSAKYNYEKK